ncbi:MAG: malate synthase, partial [Gaiellaceae bacterium]
MVSRTEVVGGVELLAPREGRDDEVLTPEALGFVAALHRRFDGTRRALLAARVERQAQLDAGELPDFLPETREVREGDWRVAPVPPELQDRRVEITGPVDRKMVINALNSGARCFMADFEDANSPTWRNCVEGQANLTDAIERTIELDTGEKTYRLGDDPAVLLVRPRGWHLPERHVVIDGEPVAGGLFDFGLYLFHNGRRLLDKGSGPYLYLPKLESHLEARLWNRAFELAQDELDAGGKSYRLNEETATLLVRPRGWHLPERHVLVDGEPVSGSLFDFGLAFFHNARELLERGSGPYFYLPKLESHLEARLWNRAFELAQDELGVPQGSIRATVLIETMLAAFEMDEILWELREHEAGQNAGRWDYIFSVIKKFPDEVLPDRPQVTMTVPFMRAYTQLLVATCHRRGAHAMGGMAAFIPSRRDPEVNETAIAKVREDKERETGDGFDGTWVAHPDLVPVATAVFDAALGERPNQLERLREDVSVSAGDLLDLRVPGGEITEAGLRLNVSVGIRYLAAWLAGTGAAAIDNLMEDAATAEISRSQVWQWINNAAALDTGEVITRELVERILEEEYAALG